MHLDFYDANAVVGRPMRPGVFEPAPDGASLCRELARAGIRRALVWHYAQCDGSPLVGNPLLGAATQGCAGLRQCWALLPPLTDGLITADFFGRMKAAGAAALRAFPDMHRYLLNRVVFGAFLDEVCERRVPVLLSLERGVSWPAVYQVLQDYPNLTCILCDIGAWSQDRYTYPLLNAYPNVHVESSMLSLEDGGVEAMAERFGAERIVFGTGFPQRYAESAALQLTHAAIPARAKADIASGNLERLLAAVQL